MTKKRKNQAMASALVAILLVSGTYAWQSFNQTVMNETAGFDADQGSRLHNDFNGNNADVYVENYASIEGSTVYTRVRLHEYMEIGEDAGTGTASIVRGDKPVSGSEPDFDDKGTWDIYLHEGNTRGEEDIRTYIGLTYGDAMNVNMGSTIYMPTFNKNFDSKTADIKGSLLGLGMGEKYDDYITYSLGESILQTAEYSKDALAAEEHTPDADGIVRIAETHVAKRTLTGWVMTMDEWINGGKIEADCWVIDVDGWAYWANGLAPQTATSLLVDNLATIRTPDANYYYALHVENQSATYDGWCEAIDVMSSSDITNDGLELLSVIAGITL